jgi:flagellar motility protein MotE (MotC chaperone)
MRRLPALRLLPSTIVALSAVLAVKSVTLIRLAQAAFPPAIAQPASEPAPGEFPNPNPKLVNSKTEAPASAVQAAAGRSATGTVPLSNTDLKEIEKITPSGGPPISESEKTLLLELRHRREQLDQRMNALNAREAALTAAEKRLQVRLEELSALQKKLEALDQARKQREEANWQGLVKMYESMRPRDAANIFNELDLEILLPLLDRMKEAKAAPILAAMLPEKARVVTAKLAERRLRQNRPSEATNNHS